MPLGTEAMVTTLASNDNGEQMGWGPAGGGGWGELRVGGDVVDGEGLSLFSGVMLTWGVNALVWLFSWVFVGFSVNKCFVHCKKLRMHGDDIFDVGLYFVIVKPDFFCVTGFLGGTHLLEFD